MTDFSTARFADIMNAAREVAFNPFIKTIEDANKICTKYGFSINELSEDEYKEFYKAVIGYWPKYI